MKRGETNPNKNVCISFHKQEDLLRAIRARAKFEDRSVSAFVRDVVKNYLLGLRHPEAPVTYGPLYRGGAGENTPALSSGNAPATDNPGSPSNPGAMLMEVVKPSSKPKGHK